MDKEYYKSLSYNERILYVDAVRRARKSEWDKDNPDKVYFHRRKTTLKRCEDRCSVPTKATIEKYKFTPDELLPIFNALWVDWGLKPNHSPADKADSEEDCI